MSGALPTDLAINIPEYTVAAISGAVKRAVEDAFGYVRVRGEISRPSFPASGHVYLRLKDDAAVLDAVVWRGTARKLQTRPEEGLEVVCTGRLTTYPGKSSYQLVIESMEPAGEGALLKMLEERRKRLAAAGLFDADAKQPLPFLPRVVGVVTSPTGAVIRDILHRLSDRFPRRVLVWPVRVQGDGAAEALAAAIAGFNRLPAPARSNTAGAVAVPTQTARHEIGMGTQRDSAFARPNDRAKRSREDGMATGLVRPDVLIVARGGGSLEDLWAFNEEVVVRAAAASDIPLISAIGHETDTTLLDHAADRRAPTPTAAAEMAVPVRGELVARMLDDDRRMIAAVGRLLTERRTRLDSLARGLGDPRRLLEERMQRLDGWGERLGNALGGVLRDRRQRIEGLRLPTPRHQVAIARRHHAGWSERLGPAMARLLADRRTGLTAVPLSDRPVRQQLETRRAAMARLDDLLESYSYERVLDRGFVLVTDAGATPLPRAPLTRAPLTRASDVRPGMALQLQFGDGITYAMAESTLAVGKTNDGAPDTTGDDPTADPPSRADAGTTGTLAKMPADAPIDAPTAPVKRRTGRPPTDNGPNQGELF